MSDEWKRRWRRPDTGSAVAGGGPTRLGRDRSMSENTPDAAETDHLDNVEDGCGCAEVWEHLSEEREAAGD